MNDMVLAPAYFASVSGGKDSMYMLKLILSNLEKYPLHGVVYFEVEYEYPFITNVINYMQSECTRHGIPFYRIKPTTKWMDLYKKYGYPSRIARWCNSSYKLSCKKKFNEYMKACNKKAIYYIGFCADEVKRFREDGNVYPLAIEGVKESEILEWAKEQPIFNDYYKFSRRCGCMYCPMQTMMEKAYLCKYYPEEFQFFMNLAKETEKKGFSVWGSKKYDTEYQIRIVREKWIPKLEKMIEEYKQESEE